ncbi:MAG: tRNA preQ1(34) S-adenosylmethionine ribosyltransferase-isomerase QueA [Chloroflexi bacterium]|nr:tRNA preQ1(34) S-adenosylmethionine ribosyltransferase-isomerase QueA [Chloroflexota bacterium]
MNTSDFDYTLPPDLIAQTPIEPRYASRLMILNRAGNALVHGKFRDVDRYLKPGDLLVLNDTRVLPARIRAHKNTGGAVEILMLRRRAPLTWEVMVGGKGVRLGTKLEVDGKSSLSAIVMEELDGARRLIQFSEPISPLLPTVGEVPLPPYIHTHLPDPERYQTVFAKTPGSAAAPTAGLHFTEAMLASLAAAGVRQAYVTLHIGLDTFAPVTEEKVEQHIIHTEWCHLPRETAKAINETRAKGGRVIAVGTTAVRTLETAARFSTDDDMPATETRPLDQKLLKPPHKLQSIQPVIGNTDLFITPGFQFQVVDALITNFHLPRSTLLMLASAFAGRERLLAAYEAAKAERYRFYSFGDAMLIL